jgi:hypothetical protein
MQFNVNQRELTIKVVFYGPALSGKTTNLRDIYNRTSQEIRGRIMTLDTADDRTLFFDLLPFFFKTSQGVKVKIKLFTVPGQVMHNSTRRIVLQGADAVAFIADSQRSAKQANYDYWKNMHENLRANGLHLDELPVVIQFNKRDLADPAMVDEIEAMKKTAREPIYMASAIRGEGVVETLYGLLQLTYDQLNARHDFNGKLGLSRDEFLRGVFDHISVKGTALEGLWVPSKAGGNGGKPETTK